MIQLEGIVEEIVYCNEINGYTVCEIMSGDSLVTIVGYMPFINVGEALKVCGKWTAHPEYGEQLKVEYYEKMLPQSQEAMERYLGSGIIKGVGPATAKKIVERFAEETMDIIQFRCERLAEIKGINLEKALRIGKIFEEQKELMKVVMFLQEHGISPACSTKIYRTFGPGTIETIKSNPYVLVGDSFGIGFKAADRIAKDMGFDPLSRHRISSGIRFVLSQAATKGHSYIPDMLLREYTAQLLEVGLESIDDALVSLVFDKSVCVEAGENGKKVYLSAYCNAELNVCKKLVELDSVKFEADLADLEERIEEIQKKEGIVLADKQKEAIREALINGVLVITGGPGTGKTTIIKTIVQLLYNQGYEAVLAAPTGRAAKRITESTGFEARTIHRLLEIGYTGNEEELAFLRNEKKPIDADVVIIDEMSMVDILLMNHLLKAIAPGTRLILVGDTDQLPSVGAGNVLKDIISSGVVKTVKLSEIFRQAEESMIIVNAHRINNGEYPFLNRKDKDFFFLSRGNADSAVKTIVELCSSRLPEKYGYDPLKHIQVLTPIKKGPLGVANLNAALQKVLNPQSKAKKEKACAGFAFREGDRVMQVRNNYDLLWEKEGNVKIEGQGVFNGDTGIIQSIDNEEQVLRVKFEDEKLAEYDFSILDELEPAYAITIHKSQGSEFPAVIIPLLQGPQVLMTRNLLYTAVTRARDIVILIGSEPVLREMISNNREAKRYSDLSQKLKMCFLK
ncbi:MAG: ATP-dependent RecD-like DNA helicase [Clostridia bacterium]|nr:ATP-dependent RecD-like DNA helicase [Clostridia bacterium]